jgi:hypothetical protein
MAPPLSKVNCSYGVILCTLHYDVLFLANGIRVRVRVWVRVRVGVRVKVRVRVGFRVRVRARVR